MSQNEVEDDELPSDGIELGNVSNVCNNSTIEMIDHQNEDKLPLDGLELGNVSNVCSNTNIEMKDHENNSINLSYQNNLNNIKPESMQIDSSDNNDAGTSLSTDNNNENVSNLEQINENSNMSNIEPTADAGQTTEDVDSNSVVDAETSSNTTEPSDGQIHSSTGESSNLRQIRSNAVFEVVRRMVETERLLELEARRFITNANSSDEEMANENSSSVVVMNVEESQTSGDVSTVVDNVNVEDNVSEPVNLEGDSNARSAPVDVATDNNGGDGIWGSPPASSSPLRNSAFRRNRSLFEFSAISNRNEQSSSEDEEGWGVNDEEDEDREEILRGTEWEGLSLSSSSSSDSSLERNITRASNLDENSTSKESPSDFARRVLSKPIPRHKWFAVKEVINRQLGGSSKYQAPELFQMRCYGSLHAVQRLELMYKLDEHKGCVNAINFNPSGTLLASASDDRKVVIWNWAQGKSVFSYYSGHNSNVFQAKFLPLSGDRLVVSCARDGQIRVAHLSATGVCRYTKLLARHARSAHKLATHPDTPHVFLSSGEDGVVLQLDVRDPKHKKVLILKERSQKIPLFSVQSNPIDSNEFCISGDDQFIRLYDRRKIVRNAIPLKKFCPKHLLEVEPFTHVTCAVYNFNGTEILGSYNDEHIYLFDTRLENSDFIHRYEGHRNSATIKGVNFFGPRSEFIVSGSDCGHIFYWDRNTEAIVNYMRGDETGVVNCLEPHPHVPMIATSGLDSDVKIWVPSCEEDPKLDRVSKMLTTNQKIRDQHVSDRGDPLSNQISWLWRQIRTFRTRHVDNHRRNTGRNASNEPAAGDQENEDFDEDGNLGCTTS